MRHRVVIIGGGFGGLAAARALRRSSADVTLVDRRNHHLFQPLLYQVATGGLSPADISAPLRGVLGRQRNVTVLLGDARDIDPESREIALDSGRISYDSLIVATGSRHHYFGNEEWSERAPGLKTVEDATEIRGRILRAFEDAERARDPAVERSLLTFVVVGGGPTGVELAGAIGELARYTLRHDFRAIDPANARIVLIEASARVLPAYRDSLSRAARRSLERLGVDVLTSTVVEEIDERFLTLRSGASRRQLETSNVVWAAGVRGSRMGRILESCVGAELDDNGRVRVAPDCSVPGHPEILVVGDLAHFPGRNGEALPGVAPVAVQQGRYAGRLVRRRLAGKKQTPFRFRNRGSLAVIGRAAAVADLGAVSFSGYPAWLLWLFVHIMYLVGFANRALVFLQWGYSYVTRNRSARLITGSAAEFPASADEEDGRAP
jgi:NADH dehydrogenase